MQGNVNIPDSTITTNLSFRQLVLMNMQQLTNFPYIEKDFDALTDYELLSLVVKYLNDVIANQNEQNDSITRMYESFLALQTYVNNTKDTLEDAFNELDDYVRNYFANLDVQEEIDNKLDEYVEDGTLEHIIASYLQTQKIYNTFDEMALDSTSLVNGLNVQTLGYHSINDGGGAFYKITNTPSNSEFQEEIGDLYATLIFNPIMNSLQFGMDSTIDSTSILQKAINVCISKKASLKLLTNINLNTLSQNIITINGNIEIDGCNNTIYNNVSGDYHALFLITGSVNIKNVIIENDEDNEPTENTGTVDSYDRVDFYLRECYNSLFENITINNCIGVWQFICVRCNNTIIKNNIINYNELYDLSYDRTSMYLNGFNIQCQNNILNGKTKARTGIESHGDNILVENNQIKGYRNPIYIVNDFTSDTIHNVNILNNYCYTERGICVWLQINDVNVDTINILNNTIITTGDWYAFYTYDVLGENFTVKNINFKNNVVKHLGTTTKESIRISPTQIGTNKNVTIENIDISNNDIKGNETDYTINLYNQLDGCVIKNIFMNNNKFFINLNTLLHYVSTQGRINNITFNNNIVRNNGTILANVSTGVKNGELRFVDNEIEKELEVIVSGNITYNTYIKGTYPIDLLQRDLKDYYFVNVHDLKGNKIETRNGVNNYTLYNDTVLTGVRFKKGDIIWNSNPVINTPIGWISISNDNFRIIQNILGGV